MADKKISQLPSGNLDSNTLFPIVSSGVTSQTTLGDLQSAIGGSSVISYVTGWEVERSLGNTITIGLGKGKIRLTNGSAEIIGLDGVDFTDETTLDSPFYQYEATVVLPNNTKRYISLDGHTDSTHGMLNSIYSGNQYNNYLSNVWVDETGDYTYYPYFIPEASGLLSYSEGVGALAIGLYSHAQGPQTTASGDSSHAEGQRTLASGAASHAECSDTIALGRYSHAEGENTQAIGVHSHAEGFATIASGDSSHSEGNLTIASGSYSHVEGTATKATGFTSHAEGNTTIAGGDNSHAEGYYTIASGANSHAEGYQSQAIGDSSHAEGSGTIARGLYSHAGGYQSQTNGDASFVHGNQSFANGVNVIVLGQNITGSTANTTYVDRLSLKTFGPYPNDAAADADANLPSGGLYSITGSRIMYRKP